MKIYTITLPDELHEPYDWIKDNIKGKYIIESGGITKDGLKTDFNFYDEVDAMAFKLRWECV